MENFKQTALDRSILSVHTMFGREILNALSDDLITDIHFNPDGTVWIDKVGVGRSCLPVSVQSKQILAAINTIATQSGQEINSQKPILSAILPGSGERFQAAIPPIVAGPSFSIRKPPKVIYTLDNYVADGVMTKKHANYLRTAIETKKNIIVAGSTGSGKTTLLNALLAEPAFTNDRIYTIEDTKELQVNAPDLVSTYTKSTKPQITMNDLVRNALRCCPDRIIVGEVRGPEALELLKAWNTGHQGGLASLHANSAFEALHRLEDLIAEVSINIPYNTIARTIDVIVFIAKSFDHGRKVETLLTVNGYTDTQYQTTEIEKE